MELWITIKGSKEPIIYRGDRIDVLDFVMDGIEYKQIRYFRNGISKSELITTSLISKMQEKKKC